MIRPCRELPVPQKVAEEAHSLANIEPDESEPHLFAWAVPIGCTGNIDTEKAQHNIHANGE